MKKAFITYLLSLCVLLLSGYGHLSAHAYKTGSFSSPITSFSGLTLAGTGQDAPDLISKSTSSNTAKENRKKLVATENEVEADEYVVFKKFLESGSAIAAVFYAFTLGFLFRYLTKCTLSGLHLAHLTSYRWHIKIQVFRI